MARTAETTGLALPPGSWALLEHLHDGGPLRVSDIAAWHGVDVSSVTPRLQSLEAEGLIERHRDARDGRVSVITIADRGREAIGNLHEARIDLCAGALTAHDMAHLPRLVAVLDRISQSLQPTLLASPADPKEDTER